MTNGERKNGERANGERWSVAVFEQAIHGGLEWWVMDCLSKEKINKSIHHTPLFIVSHVT